MVLRGGGAGKIACKRGHLLTPENIYINTSNGYPECRTCRKMHQDAYAERRNELSRKRRPKPPRHEPPKRETLQDWVARVYRGPREQALEHDRPETPDLLEVMAHGGHCPPIIGSSPLDAWSVERECAHGKVPVERCEHGCHGG